MGVLGGPMFVPFALSFAVTARADCFEDVYYSYDCSYAWDSGCDKMYEACEASPSYLVEELPEADQVVVRFEAARDAPWRASARSYYLTREAVYRDQMPSACVRGFHPAHVQEVVNGHLVYDLTLGRMPD